MVRTWKTTSLVLLTLSLASAKREVDELFDSELFQSIIEEDHVKQMIQHIKAQRPTQISGSSAMQTDENGQDNSNQRVEEQQQKATINDGFDVPGKDSAVEPGVVKDSAATALAATESAATPGKDSTITNSAPMKAEKFIQPMPDPSATQQHIAGASFTENSLDHTSSSANPSRTGAGDKAAHMHIIGNHTAGAAGHIHTAGHTEPKMPQQHFSLTQDGELAAVKPATAKVVICCSLLENMGAWKAWLGHAMTVEIPVDKIFDEYNKRKRKSYKYIYNGDLWEALSTASGPFKAEYEHHLVTAGFENFTPKPYDKWFNEMFVKMEQTLEIKGHDCFSISGASSGGCIIDTGAVPVGGSSDIDPAYPGHQVTKYRLVYRVGKDPVSKAPGVFEEWERPQRDSRYDMYKCP